MQPRFQCSPGESFGNYVWPKKGCSVGDGWGMPSGEDLKLLSGDMKGWQLDCCFGINGPVVATHAPLLPFLPFFGRCCMG